MKAVDLGGGPRGRLLTITAAVAVLTMITALFLGGCGGDGKQASTGSQLDDQSGTSTNQNVNAVSGTGGAEVLQGYTQDQCLAQMTTRYGDAATAGRVCDSIQAQYGSTTPTTQLATIVPAVETQLGVTPQPGAPALGSTTVGGNTGAGTTPGGGTTGDTSGGWGGQVITVPQQAPGP
ncbi:MAG: hypothetical protein ACYCXF_00825 [Thermoleophilia bacterium]